MLDVRRGGGRRGAGGRARGAGSATGSEAEHGGSCDTCNGERGALDGLHFGFSFVVPMVACGEFCRCGPFPTGWAPTLGWCLNGYSAARRKRMGADREILFATSPEIRREPAGNQKNPGPKTGVLSVCARGDLNPHARRHRNLNPACLPISPLARGAVVVPGQYPGGGRQAPLYLRPTRRGHPRLSGVEFQVPASLATCPVARTLYCATTTLPSGSTTIVERMRPW